MSKLKVLTVVGTRPELIRLSRVLEKLDKYCDHFLVHTGQNYDYELNQVFFDDLSLRKPDYFLNSAEDGNTPAATIGNLITAVDRVLEEVQPEAMLVLGDTNSCLAVIPAKRRKVPIFHMEAGNRCFDQRVPEEINRRIVDHTSDINLTYSNIARDYLLREGLPPDQIIKTGSPMFEVLSYYGSRIRNSEAMSRYSVSRGNYFLVSAHREENIEADKSFLKLVEILNGLCEEYKLPVLVSTHPRTRKRVESSKLIFHDGISFLKPLGFYDYVNLQLNARCVLSDSGTITEESSILNFPALNLREAHERPEGMEEAAVMMVGLEFLRVKQGLEMLSSCGRSEIHRLVEDYSIPNVSDKVVKLILSYTDYINRVVWKKY
jgi:UDP-N-acetylglucosamine 2-epimerase